MAGTTRTGLGAVRLAARALGRKVPKSRRAVSLSVLIGAVIAALAGALIAVTVPARPNRPEADREALWKIVHDRCEFGYRRTGAYAPAHSWMNSLERRCTKRILIRTSSF